MAFHHLIFGFILLITLLVGIYMFWVITPILSGLPWIPTQPQRIRKALQLAHLSPGEILYDMGSGDGRVLILAAREFGAHAIGIEISPFHYLVAWINIFVHGVNEQVEIKWANFYNANISNASVIFAYVTTKETTLLKSHLESQLHPGSRVVTISCEINGWEPEKYDREELIYVYKIK
jgi:tRNA A58 N-methylase Trm61